MRFSTLVIRAVAVASLLVFGTVVAQETSPPSDTVITTADCVNAWNNSAAAASCTTTVLEAEEAPGWTIVNTCAVKAHCLTPGSAQDTFSDFHGPPPKVESLLNCRGQLKTTC